MIAGYAYGTSRKESEALADKARRDRDYLKACDRFAFPAWRASDHKPKPEEDRPADPASCASPWR